jgi:hypothetical protein
MSRSAPACSAARTIPAISAAHSCRPSAMLSPADSAYWMKSWNTIAARLSSSRLSTSRVSLPSQQTRPSHGRYSPASSLASVVLPDPLAPTSAITSPGSIRRETSRSATRSDPG